MTTTTNGGSPRLFVLCAGNTEDGDAWAACPDSLSTNGIHDPGQAWNAPTVGACSELTTISESDAQQYTAVAPAGGLSPYATTSATWRRDCPFKPDIVMEGGIVAIEPLGFACSMRSLSLLTTHHQPTARLFDLCWATSAATALAARMSAQISAKYPDFWPETVRALMVHSARWSQPMLDAYLPNRTKTRQSLTNLLRHCGYGVPNPGRAMWSAANSLTMIVQDQLHPYRRDAGAIKTRDMRLHDLPWPTDILQSLGQTQVTLRVTLSYFIEPSPGERGLADKCAYQSHALRFAVRRPLETEATFHARINALAAAEKQGLPGGAPTDAGWTVGDSLRRRGSLWRRTAVRLSGALANAAIKAAPSSRCRTVMLGRLRRRSLDKRPVPCPCPMPGR